MNYPYNDDNMIYDYEDHRYVLTAQYVREKMGVDLEARYKHPGSVQAILNKVSDLCYDYIAIFNNAEMQKYIIAKTESGRRLILNAMRCQMEDASLNGFFDTGATKDEREMWIAQSTKRKLDNTELPEIGKVITYAGNLWYRSCDLTAW